MSPAWFWLFSFLMDLSPSNCQGSEGHWSRTCQVLQNQRPFFGHSSMDFDGWLRSLNHEWSWKWLRLFFLYSFIHRYVILTADVWRVHFKKQTVFSQYSNVKQCIPCQCSDWAPGHLTAAAPPRAAHPLACSRLSSDLIWSNSAIRGKREKRLACSGHASS